MTLSCKKFVLESFHTFHDELIKVDGAKFSKVYFYDATFGFLTNSISGLYKTTDGGATWVKINSVLSNIDNFYFKNTSVGFLTSSGDVYKTTDGGTTFTLVYAGSEYIYDIDFADDNIGYACGGNGGSGRVIKTTNGGDTWYITNENL